MYLSYVVWKCTNGGKTSILVVTNNAIFKHHPPVIAVFRRLVNMAFFFSHMNHDSSLWITKKKETLVVDSPHRITWFINYITGNSQQPGNTYVTVVLTSLSPGHPWPYLLSKRFESSRLILLGPRFEWSWKNGPGKGRPRAISDEAGPSIWWFSPVDVVMAKDMISH